MLSLSRQNKLIYYVKGGLHGRIFMKIDTILNTCYTSVFFCVNWKIIFGNEHVWSFISFVFIFLLRWTNLNKLASILACKDYKINTKTSKILFILLMLIFRLFGLFTLCSHATKFSSLSTHLFFYFMHKHWNK